MGKANRIIAVCVTAAMAFQMLAPAPEALAQETSVFANALPLVSQNTGDASDGSQDTGESDVQASASESESDAAESGGSASDDSQGIIGGADADAANGNTSVKKAASESEVATQADSGYAIMTVEGLKAVLGEGSVEFGSDGAVTKIKVGAQNDKLLALSNTDPKLYQHATITRGTGTGAGLDVTGTVRLGSADYKFRGFGSEDYPFDGSFALGEETITLDKALFNNVKLTEDRALNLVWTGTDSQPIVAKKIDGNGWTLKATVTTAATYSKTDTSKVKLTSPLLGDVAGSLALEATYGTVNDKPLAIDAESSSDNIGLLANTVAKGGSLSVNKFEGLPENYEGTPTIKTTADGKNAGGLIGECESGATVAMNDSVDLSQFTVAGKNASGGFIGKAADLTLNIGPNVVVKPARTVGDADSSYSGGIIGDVRFAGSHTVSPTAFSFDDVVTLGARYRAGCLFGRADISNGDITVQSGTYKSQLTSGDDGNKGDPKTRGSYGGLVGNVFATSKDNNEALRAFVVKKGTDGNKVAVEFDHKSALCYAGGVAGYVGDKTASDVQPVAVVLDGVSVACKGDASARQGNGRYGGAVGVVDMYDVLDVRDFSLTSDKALGGALQQRSAGIAGSAWIATIKFSGITDLSGAAFAENATTGQLANENYNSLIFADGNGSNGKIEDDGTATGWTLQRPNSGSKTDDLATYGEVVRLGEDGLSSELLELDSDTHILTKAESLARDGSACTLADKNDFAKLAVTWQTNGYYSMVQGITPRGDDANNGLGNLPASTITVTSTIDLSGTGLTGLTKDRVPPTNQWEGGIESSQLFSGKLTGDGTINLAVGEPYGMRGDSAIGSSDSSAGNGRIYRHGRLGLFGGVTTNAVVENVTVGGFMRFENGGAIDAGAVAGTVAGAAAFSGVKVTTNITYTSSNGDNALQIGGIAGSISAAATVDFSNNATAQAAIAADGETQGETRVGGAIGCVAAEATPTLNVTGLKIGGSITAESESKKVAQIGGFIGSIGQGASGVRKTVSITGLAFDGFTMNVGTNGDAKNGAGGLLGYSWGNAVVTIGGDANSNSTYALTTNDTSVTANGATEFGGLLYVMSGHLVINDYALDLSNASLSATSATSFGVLLARSGVSDANHRFGAEDAYTGLYLEDRAEWATAYKVPDDRKISAGAVTYFDEWVAATTRPGSTTMNGECNGLISLHTVGEKLYMGSGAAQDNSYQNRTDVGKQYKTNQNARYYYNLDRCLTEASPSGSYQKGEPLERGADSHKYWIKSPQALMIWSACRNSPSGLYGYIAPGLNFNTGYKIQIGNADSSLQRTNLDLDGYSYYPVDVSGELKVLNTNVSFHYTDIKDEQQKTADNKSNAAFTQHANMHLALFRVVFGAYQVENVNLAGSVGCVVNGSDPGTSTGNSNSGALFCRAMSGKSNGIIQASLNNVVLDGLTVDGADQKKSNTDPTYIYAPLLMNDFTSYVTLDVQNLSVKEGSYGTDGNMEIAASSLFGKFGTGNSNQVNASFHDNVELPSGKNPGVDGIFTRASFFDSFGYGASSTGSANYIFNTNDKVTYGEEIDSNGTEHGKQLWYYDASDYGDPSATDGSLVTDKDITANNDNPQFGSKYLPYVYNKQKDESGNPKPGYREIKVNQHPAHLVTGCGTYSDPYVVKNAHELYTLANYINSANSAVDGWQVTITTDQNQTCTHRSDQGTSYEATYEFSANGRQWKKVAGSSGADTLDNDIMHLYMQSAYYSIEPADDKTHIIEVNAATFGGFGNHDNPFRGVIVGDLDSGSGNATISIKGANGSTFGLVPYSYGSVVRNLQVKYDSGANNVGYNDKYDDGTPKATFGGVIGCIMGGDNIIDGVSVSSSGEFVVAGAGDKAHLVPVGGYVGAICGGGVIFRNMGGSSNWHSDTVTDKKLYDNPYVGRVIDGYAFSEGCMVDNGNENYKVNKLDTNDTGCVTTDKLYPRDGNTDGKASAVTVKDAQGLLVLSAIINSGAAAGPTWASDAYYGSYSGVAAYKGSKKTNTGSYSFGNGNYGKVRNATYVAVGEPNKETGDRAVALKDDQRTPGAQSDCVSNAVTEDTAVNSPYLVSRYADKLTGYICAPNVSGVKLQFVEKTTNDAASNSKTFDMRSYGSGFLGLSGRYYSNACNGGEKSQDRDRIVPAIGCIDGNGFTILVNNQAKQYTDDDYSVQAVGGLFGAVMFANLPGSRGDDGCLVKNLQFGDSTKASDGNKSSSVSLTLVDSDGNATTSFSGGNYCVGMLAGTTANRESLNSNGKYSNVRMKSCSIESPKIAGGLLGASGWARRENGDSTSSMIHFDDGTDYDAWKQSPVKLFDCSYEDIDVAGGSRVGGFVGALGSGSDSGIWVTKDDFAVGKDSTIRATADNCIVGGAFGLSWSTIQINAPLSFDNEQAYKTVTMRAVAVQNNNAVGSDGDGAKYRGTGGIVGNAQSSCEIRNVLIEGGSENDAMPIGGTAPSSGDGRFQSAGAVVGQINGTGDGVANSFDDVTVRNVALQGKEGTGGLVGTVFNGSKVRCSDISVSDIAFGETFSGGLVGTIKSADTSLEAQNVKVENCTFSGEACSAIAGDGKGTFSLSNVLVTRNKYQTEDNQGLLLGKTWSTGADGDLRGLYVAGLDIVPEEGKSTSDPPDYDAAAQGYTTLEEIHKVSYVALADYNDSFDKVEGSSLYNDERAEDGTMPAVNSVSPYVTTNPVSANPKVRASEGADAKSLFSDGAASYTDDDNQIRPLANTIKSEAGSSLAGKYTYTNIGGIKDSDGTYQNEASYNPETADSTFNANNTSNGALTADTNFPVLLIPGNDTTTVESYLNVVTNGGFSDACRLNPSVKSDASHVTATTETFELKKTGESKAFVKKVDGTPSLSVVSDGTGGMKFWASSDWDNEKGRFTLLTVTFHEAGTTYKVQVPIIVKRMLEIDFAATYSEGTNFSSADYKGGAGHEIKFDKHVLISSGDTMTGYLTWTYNQALGVPTEYGWNTLLASGGSMKPLDKTIDFSGDKGRLPEGTQLTLIDTAHGDKEYHCTVGKGGATSVKLTDFYREEGEAKTYYQEQWLSETFDATASEDASGAWVKLDDSNDVAKAGAKVSSGDNQGYYRKKTNGDTTGRFYTLTVSDESPRSENFYLVVRTPKKSARVNGYTRTSVSTDLNYNIHHVLRKANSDGSLSPDGWQNTASTYSIASNYTHELKDNLSNVLASIYPTRGSYSLEMDVSDTISFGSQEYGVDDELYFQLDSSLVNYNETGSIGASGYPTGTRGTYSFFVTVGGTYYTCARTWNEKSEKWDWEWTAQDSAEPVPVVENVEWVATGDDMSITLDDAPAAAGESRIPIDLSGIREIAQNSDKSFTITMKADLTMSEPAGEQGIVASQEGKQHTRPSYRALLSTHASTLRTSGNTAYNHGNKGYYRQDSGSSSITLEASMKSQLGINIDDLSLADGTIRAIGSYDLKQFKGADATIAKANKVKYTLSLQKRTGTNEDGSGVYTGVPIGEYLKVTSAGTDNVLGGCDDSTADEFSWEDQKGKSGTFKTLSDDSLFRLPLTVKVDTTKDAHTYANYRLVLTAQLCLDNAVLNTPSNTSDYITYTLTRVNLKGIS